jgi:hypothetical protein
VPRPRRARRLLVALPSAFLLLVVAGVGLVWFVGPRFNVWLVPPTPQRYGDTVLTMLDGGLHASSPQWHDERERARGAIATAATLEDVDAILAEAVQVAGGPHSTLVPARTGDTAPAPQQPASVERDGGVATLVVPEFTGDLAAAQAYTDTLATGLAEPGVCGVVVDLRGNSGGDMGPMVAGVAKLLPDGVLQTFVTGERRSEVRLTRGRVTGGGTSITAPRASPRLDVPVAVLVDERTASSGEQTLVALRGRDHVRVFGVPTAGYASVNQQIPLYTGATLQLTVGVTESHTGELLGEEPIPPDTDTGSGAAAADAARAWLTERGCA